MSKWDAELYLRFSDERTQPALDLATRIAVSDPRRVVDLGCGPGNSTAILRSRWPQAVVVGLDNSPEMIAAAAKTCPEGKWVLADAATWSAELPFDIVFSNATLQWLPNHALLFPRLFSQVASGGALAVQMPAHFNSPLHREILETADDPRWCHLMGPARNAMTKEPPAFYYNLLQPLGARVEIWETEYYHSLESPRAIIEWFRATGLRPYLTALESEEQKQSFEEQLLARYSKTFPPQSDGRILFPFRRLFIVSYRP
ncbi:MAG: methyltransferase domain-containing protein [Syntrophobacteraceae bacterium]